MEKQYELTTTATMRERVERAYWLNQGIQAIAKKIAEDAEAMRGGDVSELGYAIDAITYELGMELAALADH